MNEKYENMIADLRATVDDTLAQIDALLAASDEAKPTHVLRGED